MTNEERVAGYHALKVAGYHARLVFLQTRMAYCQHRLIQAEGDMLEHEESEDTDDYGSGSYSEQGHRFALAIEHWQEQIETIMEQSTEIDMELGALTGI